MKRASAIILCALLMTAALTLIVYAGAEGDRSLILVYALPETAPVTENRKTGGPHWYYTIRFQETSGIGLDVSWIRRSIRVNGQATLDALYDANMIAEWFGSTRIRAYGLLDFSSGRPADSEIQGELWEIAGTDDRGNNVLYSGEIMFSASPLSQTPQDLAHDTRNLRRLAGFEIPVAEGVWWVPAASLGDTGLSIAEIGGLLDLSPEKKRDAVDSLYEALQLFQTGVFDDAEDKIYIEENGIVWEHHKPGYDAIRTNKGCCATNSNWLNYLLRGDYDETGYLAYSQADGSGHVLNYIRDDGFWYFIDLTHYRMDFLSKASIETGSATDYLASDYVAGNLHKAASPLSYIRYCLGAFSDPPGLFFLYAAENCLPLSSGITYDKTVIYYPKGVDISVLYDNLDDHLTYEFVDPPAAVPDWSSYR